MLALLLVAFQLESLTVQPQPAAVVDPARALGGALDGHAVGDTRRLFRPALVDTMRQAGWHLF
ncbi:MAG: hypothetical protein HY275_17945, partial [Gemmatimonadetes bacterium]|nr:hypothetical protein [Gemmatimonadota bacterium]